MSDANENTNGSEQPSRGREVVVDAGDNNNNNRETSDRSDEKREPNSNNNNKNNNNQRNGRRGRENSRNRNNRRDRNNNNNNSGRGNRESHPGVFNPVTASVSSSLSAADAAAAELLRKEDPRLRDASGQLVKEQKQRGGGRNTESFNPESTLVRPDMRVLVGSKHDLLALKEGRIKLKHDDVLVVPEFFCAQDDWSIYNQLVREMRESQRKGVPRSQWISWHEGAHLISDNPSDSATFQDIQRRIAEYFDIEQKNVGTRFNWYKDSSDWKPFHHDSAAFNPMRAKNQNITVGVSFGASRELAFLHAKTNTRIYFPQTNGMLFSFGRDVNIQWKHGVNYIPVDEQQAEIAMHSSKVDPDITVGRISIILWGNCPLVKEEANSPPLLTDNTRGHGHNVHRGNNNGNNNAGRKREREGERKRDDDNRERSRRADSRERDVRRDTRDVRRDDSRERRERERERDHPRRENEPRRGDSRERR